MGIRPLWALLLLVGLCCQQRNGGPESAGSAKRNGLGPSLPYLTHLPFRPSETLKSFGIQDKSRLSLAPSEIERLDQNGFVISDMRRYETPARGYQAIWTADLPVYVTADALMFAVFKSHDRVLADVETKALIPDLRLLLQALRASLTRGAGSEWGRETVTSIDEFVAVALSLLDGRQASAVAGGESSTIAKFVSSATNASGPATERLFGRSWMEDFSMYKPRGHYTRSAELQQYFRAAMWLGRAKPLLLEVAQDGSKTLSRPALGSAIALTRLLKGSARESWARIDTTVQAFVGDADATTVGEIEDLDRTLGRVTSESWPSDADLIAALEASGRKSRIASSLVQVVNGQPTKALPISFALLPRRYTIDSHVFTDLTYDRVGAGAIKRMMPSALDVGYAVLDNDVAGSLLSGELSTFHYQTELLAARSLADRVGPQYWRSSLYGLWLNSLRALSPSAADLKDLPAAHLPSVAATEPWARRILNTQLASWAELRHNNVLYAEQSVSAGIACSFPDGYVEPYPEFFDRLSEFAARGREILAGLSKANGGLRAADVHYQRLHEVAQKLGEIARDERRGKSLTPTELAYLNQMVEVHGGGCSGPERWSGWYPELFYDAGDITDLNPPITDVHTQPTNENGDTVGRILHVGTGLPRLFIVTIDSPGPPRAFAGVVSSYFERVTKDFHRLTDEEWQDEMRKGSIEDPVWLKSVVVH
jgi:hypothetical protein